MDRPTLLKKLDVLLEEFSRAQTFGSIEIIFRRGEPDTLHRLVTEKLNQLERENIHHEYRKR